MDEFLDVDDQPKLNQDKTNDLNRPIITKKVDVITKNLPS